MLVLGGSSVSSVLAVILHLTLIPVLPFESLEDRGKIVAIQACPCPYVLLYRLPLTTGLLSI
eukprot:jgi/Botrbrau1/4273/Bobra.0390s0013.1